MYIHIHTCICLFSDVWNRQGTPEWCVTYIWMSRVMYKRDTIQMRIYACMYTYLYIYIYICIYMYIHIYVCILNETCHTWMNYVTYEWVTAHIWMSHGTHVNESRHTYEWVTAHIWMSHGTHINELYVSFVRDTTHL